MLHIALYEPEIPQNTGTIGRLCVATDTRLHLIGKLGFSLEDKYVRRSGLDYWPKLDKRRWETWDDFLANHPGQRIFALTTKTQIRYTEMDYQNEDIFLFGPETRGLPQEILGSSRVHSITIPQSGPVRSINLACATGIALYEGLRQLHSW